MTLSEIIALPDSELYGRFEGCRCYHDEDDGSYCILDASGRAATDAYGTRWEAWDALIALAPTSDVWLPLYDLAVEAGFRFEPTAVGLGVETTGMSVFKNGVDYWCEGKPSAALIRAVLACYIYTHQPEQK